MSLKKIAVVTGANRGLGLATAQKLADLDFEVIFAVRDIEKLGSTISELKARAKAVHALVLDVSSEDSLKNFADEVEKKWGRVDVLINNAGVYLDRSGVTLAKQLRDTFETNVLGPYILSQRFLPLMAKKGYGRVVNVSSGMGQLSEMGGGSPAYRISKTALNAVTKVMSVDYKADGVLVNAVCPGWVKTDMGGAGATRTLEQGIDTIVWAATLPDGAPTGSLFRDRKMISW